MPQMHGKPWRVVFFENKETKRCQNMCLRPMYIFNLKFPDKKHIQLDLPYINRQHVFVFINILSI